MTGDYEETVAGYASFLREGGTTPWSRWSPVAATAPAGPAPTAVHVELLRLLNLQGSHAGLADVVLSTPTPGRGRVDVPLPWSGGPPAFGQPPADPDDLPAEELLRLAVGVLGRLLPQVPDPPPPADLARWPMPWRRRFRLHGAPGTVAAVRRALLAQGLVETDWRPVHLVLARPVDQMLAEHWASVAVAGGLMRWGTLWHRMESRGSISGRLDVAGTAQRLAVAARGRERVHLLAARDDAEIAHLVEQVLGLRRLDVHTFTDPARVDLLRRTNRHSGVTHGAGRIRRIAQRLAHVLDEGRPPVDVPPPAPPAAAASWAVAAARELTDRVAREHERAGYAVHGDPAALAPAGREQGGVDPERTLDEALWACREAWRRQEGTRG